MRIDHDTAQGAKPSAAARGGAVWTRRFLDNRRTVAIVLAAAIALASAGCAVKRPVLYAHRSNDPSAERDIEECMRLADEGGADNDRVGKVAGSTAGGATVGGATGAVVGGVYGGAGRAAGAGAAAGATGGFFRGLFRWREPDPVFRGYVERCLRDRGYDPIGWR